MGIFSTKKKITVATSVSRVIEDNKLPNSVLTGLLKGLMSDPEQIVENVLEDMSSSIAVRTGRMYSYAKKYYTHGLPKSDIVRRDRGSPLVESVIEALEGKDVTLDYNVYAPFNSIHYGWTQLVNLHGYDAVSNEITSLTAQMGRKVYLDDLYVVVPMNVLDGLTPTAMVQWGPPAKFGYTPSRPMQDSVGNIATMSQPQVSALITVETIVAKYVWVDMFGELQTGTLEFVVPEVADDLTFFQARYSYQEFVENLYNPKTGVTSPVYRKVVRYFTYQEGSGTYSGLDTTFQVEFSELGSFFPFTYFRYNKRSESVDTNSPTFKTSKKMLKYLGMDYDAVGDAINANPDIDDVEQAMMVMAVPHDSVDPVDARYLFDFFSEVANQNEDVPRLPPVTSWDALLKGEAAPTISVIIQDARFKMRLGMADISKKIKAGTIGAVGQCTSVKGIQTISQAFEGVDESANPTTVMREIEVETMTYRKQVTAGIYHEIAVTGLEMYYHIFGVYTATAETTLVPVDFSISRDYNNRDREILYSRSLHYVFNSKFVTKIKWYQQGWFQIVIIIISVIVIIISMGGATGLAMAALALAEMTISELIVAAIVMVLKMVVINIAFKLFVKLVGVEFAILVALVAAVAGVIDASLAVDSATGIAGAPFASELLQLSAGLAKAAGDYYTEALQGIQKEYDSFGIEAKAKTELLDKANKLLESDSILSPFVIFGESPSDYYQRTVHSGNIGIYSIDAVSSYVDSALKLPEIHETIKDT